MSHPDPDPPSDHAPRQVPSGLHDTHTHTSLCGHAQGVPLDYARAAHARGLSGITVTCHNPMPNGYAAKWRMSPDEFPHYLALVEHARDVMRGKLDVRLGLECDFLPEHISWLATQITSADFDFLLGSVHPQLGEYRARFWTGDPLAYQRQYYEHLALAAESSLFDALAHPDFVRVATEDAWRPELILDDARRAFDRIARTGVALELNSSGYRKTFHEPHPGPLLLQEITARGIPVTLGSDAHAPDQVGFRFHDALSALRALGVTHVARFERRSPIQLPIHP